MNIQEVLKNAELFFHQGNLSEAREQFLIALDYEPDNKEIYNNLGVIAFSEKQYEKAISYFKKAIAIDPLYMIAIVNMSDVLHAQNSFNDPIPNNPDQIQEKALPLNPHGEVGKKELSLFKSIKVIHLPLIIANNAIALSKHLNHLGVDSKVISYFRTWLNYQGDINLDLDGLNVVERNKKIRTFVDYFFENEAHKYDIFHFHFFDSLSTGKSFGGWKSHPEREDFWDLEYIKNMGKKIVVSSWGSDVRNNSKMVYYQLKYEDQSLEIPYPPLNRKDQYLKIWKFAQHADVVVHGDCETVKHTPYGKMIPIGIDLEPFDLLMKENRVPAERKSVLYAPSNQFYKGTNYTEAVLKRITERYGEKIEIQKIHGLPYQEAIKKYLGYGAAVDDIAIFSFGLFTLEAMYLGRTVFTTLCKEEYFGEDPKLKTPIISVHSENDFFRKLTEFIETDRSDHHNSYKSFIRENFSSSHIAYKYKELYEQLMSRERIEQYVSQEWNQEFNLLVSKRKIDMRDYYTKVTDILLIKNDFDKLFHEVQMGSGLNDDCDLLAKYVLMLELMNQKEKALEARKNNNHVVSTQAFVNSYNRAKELYYSNNHSMPSSRH
jgi:tetratricopeptide (TPR) repeat protein